VTIVQSRKLRVTQDGIEVTIKAFVPANDDQMPVRVEFAPRIVGLLAPGREEGLANDWIVLRTSF
jgi:hypothetical protein